MPKQLRGAVERAKSPSSLPTSARGGSLVGFLYSITERATFDIATRTQRLADRIPPGTVVAGIDAGGNWIVLGVSGPRAGKVFFVDHEELEGSTIDERTRAIAGSWTEFVDGLGTSPSRRRKG